MDMVDQTIFIGLLLDYIKYLLQCGWEFCIKLNKKIECIFSVYLL